MSSQGRPNARIPKVLAAALLTGGISAAALMLATQLRAQTPPPAAAPPPPAAAAPAPPPAAKPPEAPPAPTGFVPMTSIPFYADWASSPHADKKAEPFNHWNKEGVVPADCARCHSTPGFRDYVGADGSTPFKVDHPAPIGTVITCVACHNDKTLRLSKVIFPSGITVNHLGAEARCMTCHQGRESTKSVNAAIAGLADDQITPKLDFINVHYAAAGATLYGGQVQVGYEYPGKTYAGRFMHKKPYTTCISCHNPHTTGGQGRRLRRLPSGSHRQGLAGLDPHQQGRSRRQWQHQGWHRAGDRASARQTVRRHSGLRQVGVEKAGGLRRQGLPLFLQRQERQWRGRQGRGDLPQPLQVLDAAPDEGSL